MSDYKEQANSLREHADLIETSGIELYGPSATRLLVYDLRNAAAAIEDLQADVKRLKECNDELREAQTYIDHYGDKWMTSAKDVPTSAYNHGYMDGKNEAEAAQPHWVSVEEPPRDGQECIVAHLAPTDWIYEHATYHSDLNNALEEDIFIEGTDGFIVDGDVGYARHSFNYWMPIEPPKEVQNADYPTDNTP